MARKRFKNITQKLQVVYDETGVKHEIVPSGTVILEEAWGKRFSMCLSIVGPDKVEKKGNA